MPEPVNIVIDGRPVQTASGELLIKAAQDHGTYIPRFCWHPRMKPVGMCRMCLVQIETPRGPALITACTNTVAEGMVVHTQDEIVKKAQEGILEFLLINHPLDCPVCDRGGECPLQDQVMAYGPGESRFVEEKRHFEKPIPISDLVFLDRERCILCARCTRFSEEVSGDPLLVFKERGNYTQIQTFPDEPFRSYFSGNTVQICPVGALTSSAYRFKARPWDLTAVESTCTHCTAGDRISVQSSQNQIIRFLGVDSDATNHGWLSDKCRFGFEYLGSADRLTAPLLRQTDGSLVEVSWSEALDVVSKRLGEIVAEHSGGAVAGLGGARGTNEDAYAFGKFLRSVIGTPHLDAQMDDGLDPQFLATVADRATLADLDSAGAILVWAADLKEEHPTLYLRVRRAAQELGVQLVVIHPRRTGLDDRASIKLTYRPGAGGDLLTRIQAGELTDLTAALSKGSVVALIGRTGYTEDPRLAEAVAAFIRSLPGSKLLPLARRSNVYGALDMGLAPTLLPGRVSAVGGGRDCRGILEGLRDGALKAVILCGADPVRDVPDGRLARQALEAANLVVALDLFLTDSSRMADVVFPALGFGEKDGTVTNVEGRVQTVNRVVPGPGQARPDWSVFDDLASRLGQPLGFGSVDAIGKEISATAPAYEGITREAIEWTSRDGVLADLAAQGRTFVPTAVESKSVSAELVLHYARVMYDDGVLVREGPSLAPLAPGGFAALHPDDAIRLGLLEGQRVVVAASGGEADLPLQLDASLARGTVYVPFNQAGVPSLGTDPVATARSA